MKNYLSLVALTTLLLVNATYAPQLQADSKGQTLEESSTKIELVDPTQPNWFGLKAAKKKSAKSLRLDSLVTGAQRRLAVINGVMMREGDTKNGITVQNIFEDRVLIRTKSGQKKTLKLKKANNMVKTKSAGNTRVSEETIR